MNIKLLRQFIMEYLPEDPEAQFVLNDVFNELERNPTFILNNALLWNHFKYFKDSDRTKSVCAANGVVLGFALAYSVYKYPELEKDITAYLEASAKRRGENVVNFLQRKGQCV